MKKILFMCINMNVGGTEKALLGLLNSMSPKEYNIKVLMLEAYGGFLDDVPEYVEVEYIKGYDKLKYLLSTPMHYAALQAIKEKKIIKALGYLYIYIRTKAKGDLRFLYKYMLKDYSAMSEKFDVAVAYAGPMDFITYFILEKVQADKKVQWVHFDVSRIKFYKNIGRDFYTRFDKVYTVSKEGREKLVQIVPELIDKTDVFYNVISKDLIMQQAQEKGFDDEFDSIRILTVGRLSDEKGQDLCIEAMKILIEKGINAKWYFIGEGKLRCLMEKKIEQYKLKDNVELLGIKKNPYPYMKECDIYVQPSRHEGYCITLAEARCFNCDIVTTDFTGAREQIQQHKKGVVVKSDSYSIYEGIEKVISCRVYRNN